VKITLVKGSNKGRPHPPHDVLMIEAENSVEELFIAEVMIDIEALVSELEGKEIANA
jgi:hypothetical protein